MATAVKTRSTRTRKRAQSSDLVGLYAGDLVHSALMEIGEPAKASDIVKVIDRSDVGVNLVRVVLATDPRMISVDRKWTLRTRYQDPRGPMSRALEEVIQSCGRPVRLAALARELASIYGRSPEVIEPIVDRLTAQRAFYFRIEGGYVAPTAWLLDTTYNDDEEVLFENFLDDEDVNTFVDKSGLLRVSPDRPQTFAALLDKVGEPMKGKALQYVAWRADKDRFSATHTLSALFLDSAATALSDGRWIGPKLAQRLAAGFAKLSEREVVDVSLAETPEAAQPLAIGDAERDQLIQAVLTGTDSVHAARLLEDVLEVTARSATYDVDLESVRQALSGDSRVVWVGTDRFRAAGSIPGYALTVPVGLQYETREYLDEDGNSIDQMLEDEGFDGGLAKEILNPLAQDVLDEEPVAPPDPSPPSTARAVIKYHHKQIGTLPLCLFPPGFFPPEPKILDVDFTLPGGRAAHVWVNNGTRLIYGPAGSGVLEWFDSIPMASGATFTVERQAPDHYIVNYNDESEPSMFISDNRISELEELRGRAEAEKLPTFDIVLAVTEHYRKGIEFLTLHTEVNVARRVPRRLVASLLSGYHCFFQRGGAWVYDAKKRSQGFDKSKRKYLAK